MLRQTLRATRSQLQEMSLRSLVFAEEYSKRCFSSSGGRLRKIKLRSFQGGGGGSSARSHRATRMTIDKTPSVQPSAAPASRLDKKEFAHGVAIISLSTLSFTVNIPLGSVRSGFDSFGMEWWLTLGAAVPFCVSVPWTFCHSYNEKSFLIFSTIAILTEQLES